MWSRWWAIGVTPSRCVSAGTVVSLRVGGVAAAVACKSGSPRLGAIAAESPICAAAGSRRHASQAALLPKVRVDGRRAVYEVLREMEAASKSYSTGLSLQAVGQPGVVAALHAMAELRHAARAPAFVLSSFHSDEAQGTDAVEDPYGRRPRLFLLELPAADAWRPEAQRQLDSRLVVSNNTNLQPLAKAIAARSGLVKEGDGVAVETALVGTETRKRFRISVMAQALARAHKWQVAPVDDRLPTRRFRCCVELVRANNQDLPEGAPHDAWALRVEVFPEGPPKRIPTDALPR